jgi:urease accessory protein
MTTPTEPLLALGAQSFLQLMWLASPALPIGGFSYSEGLEAAINAALVTTETEAAGWLVQQLHLTQSRGDMAVIAQAMPAWKSADLARIASLNQWVRVTRETSELRLQTEQMGRSLTEWLKNRYADDNPGPIRWLAAQDASYPIAFSLAGNAPAPRRAMHCWPMPLAGQRTWFRPPSRPSPWARAPASAFWRD